MAGFLQTITWTMFVLLGTSSENVSAQINVVQMSQQNSAPLFEEKPPQMNGGAQGFRFASYFQSHMVLQQAPAQANIYGYSPAIGARVIALVTSEYGKRYYVTTVEEGPEPGVGKWVFSLDALKTSAAVTIDVFSDLGHLSLSDVLFGDVWLCSGQSNMQFTLSMMNNGSEEIANAHKYPNIRLMTVAMEKSDTPLYDLIKIEENWSLPSAASVGDGAWTYFSAVCWLYGKTIHEALGYPIGLVATDWGGTPIQAWSSPDALAKCNVGMEVSRQQLSSDWERQVKPTEKRAGIQTADERFGFGGPHNKTVLWNSMIHPLLGLTFYGAIWYQGENDAVPGLVDHYNCSFPVMIEDWRSKFSKASNGQTSDKFPFGFVQIGTTDETAANKFFPDIRWHQTADIGFVPNDKLQNVFMAVAMDLDDETSVYGRVHPRDKTDVAQRLALSGLAVAYGRTEFFQGPLPINVSVAAQGWSLLLDYGPNWQLDLRSNVGFEVLCVPTKGENQDWVPASISNSSMTSISLSLDQCAFGISAVRYAWAIVPCPFKRCAVYCKTNSLPAPPFIKYL